MGFARPPAPPMTGMLTLALATLASSQLPAPGGEYAVGVTSTFVVDESRNDRIAGGPRKIGMRIWYPAAASTGPGESYFASRRVLEALMRGDFYASGDQLRAMESVITAARGNARAAAARPKGVIFFSHGLGVPGEIYSAISQELSSRGYIVVMLAHPYGGVAVIDGRLRSLDDDDSFHDTPEEGAVLEQEWGRTSRSPRGG